MIGATRMTKKDWYRHGGLAIPGYFRKMRNGAWTYWRN